jgi:hypothetical protein
MAPKSGTAILVAGNVMLNMMTPTSPSQIPLVSVFKALSRTGFIYVLAYEFTRPLQFCDLC